MYVYIFVNMYMCVCICMYVLVAMYKQMYIHVYINMYLHVHTCVYGPLVCRQELKHYAINNPKPHPQIMLLHRATIFTDSKKEDTLRVGGVGRGW